MKEYIAKVVDGKDLTEEEARAAMKIMLEGEATQAQIASFLTALRMKGETLEELVGLASVLRDKAETISPDVENYVDLVGTGGDCTYTFNVSTTAAFVVAAAGLPVAKHGNRSISSKSGAGDVLEALGVNIMAEPELVQKCVEKVGIGFMFAQLFNKSMKYVGQARKEMGIRTVFNILGPLSNPAGANMQVMGVYDEKLVEPLARVLSNLGVKNAMVVYGQDCLDEISMSARTSVCEIKDGKFRSYEIEPEQFGFKKCDKEELVGGTPEENAKITLSILNGEKGPRREAVLMNAGAAFYVAGKADTLEDAVKLAAEIIDSGKAKARLDEFIKLSNQE